MNRAKNLIACYIFQRRILWTLLYNAHNNQIRQQSENVKQKRQSK